MQLLVQEKLAQQGEQELVGQVAPVGQRIGGPEMLHRTRDVDRALDVFHLDHARRGAVDLGHPPHAAVTRPPREGGLHLGLALELQLVAEALDETIDLLGHGLQEGGELAVRRPVLARHQHQRDRGLAHQEFAVQVVAADLDDHRHQLFHAAHQHRFLGQVDRADRAGLDRPFGVETEIDVLRRAAEAFDQRGARLLRRHRRHILLEHRQLACDFLRQEVGRGRRHLRHLDEEGAELAHHLRHDLRLRAVVLGVGLEEGLDVAQRPDLAADDLEVAAHHLHAPQQRVHAVLVAVVDVLELVDHLHQQRLIRLQDQARDVQPQVGQAAQLGVGHELVEEGPELVDDLLRHRDRRTRHRFAHHVVDQALGGALVGQHVARTQVGGDGAGLLRQRVGVERLEDAVDVATELGLGEVGFTAELADQRSEGGDDPRGGIGQRRGLQGQLARATQQAHAPGAHPFRCRRFARRRPAGRGPARGRLGGGGPLGRRGAGTGPGFAGGGWRRGHGKILRRWPLSAGA